MKQLKLLRWHNEPELGQRSGRLHVEDNINIEGTISTIETNSRQRSEKQHVVESICSQNIVTSIGIDSRL